MGWELWNPSSPTSGHELINHPLCISNVSSHLGSALQVYCGTTSRPSAESRSASPRWVNKTRSSTWQRLCCHRTYTPPPPHRPALTVMSRDVLPSSPLEAKSHLIIEEVPDGVLLVLAPFSLPAASASPPTSPSWYMITAHGGYPPQHVSRLISHTADTEHTCSDFLCARIM